MRKFFGILWFVFMASALYLYFFHADIFQNQFGRLVQASLPLAYTVFTLLGVIRGFTLIPVTYLIVLGLLFFPPLPLFLIIISGVVVSSATVYYFFDFLNLDSYFEKNHPKQVTRIKTALEKNELPIIIAWSAMPFLPTDVICYICGTLEIEVKKFLLGIFIGEGITCAIYIFFGHVILNYLHIAI